MERASVAMDGAKCPLEWVPQALTEQIRNRRSNSGSNYYLFGYIYSVLPGLSSPFHGKASALKAGICSTNKAKHRVCDRIGSGWDPGVREEIQVLACRGNPCRISLLPFSPLVGKSADIWSGYRQQAYEEWFLQELAIKRLLQQRQCLW